MALDGVRQLGAQPLELVERGLEIAPLRRQIVEPRLLGVVFLLRERIDTPERFAAALEPLELVGKLLAVVTFRRVGPGFVKPLPRRVRLGTQPRELDVDRPGALAVVGLLAPQIRFGSAEPPQLRGELAGLHTTDIGAGSQRRLESGRFDGERRVETLRKARQPSDDGIGFE